MQTQLYYTNAITKATTLIVALVIAFQCQSQSNYFGSWNVANAEYFFNQKIGVWGEVQLRSQKFFNDFYYHELKTGINFHVNKSFGILLGIGQYETYSNGGNFKSPLLSHKFRTWEQFTLVNNIGRIKLEHRYRIEQRWRNDEYRNRFRYRINPIIPVNKNKIENHTLFATLYDEIFLTDQPSYFERNRFFAGAGYQLNSLLTFQTGWIRQFDYSATTSSAKDFLQTTIFIRLNQKGPAERHPASMD